MSAHPARFLGIPGRGTVEAGRPADLNAIEVDGLALGPLTVAHDLPGGVPRLFRGALGYRAVLTKNPRIVLLMRMLRYDAKLRETLGPLAHDSRVARLCEPPSRVLEHVARRTERWFEEEKVRHPKPSDLRRRLESPDAGDWWSAWWELASARLLRHWKVPEVQFEPAISGKKPDLLAIDESGCCLVEVFALLAGAASASWTQPAVVKRLPFGQTARVPSAYLQNQLRREGRRLRVRFEEKLAAYENIGLPLVLMVGLSDDSLWPIHAIEALTGPMFDENAGWSGVSDRIGCDGALSNDPEHPRVRNAAAVLSLRWQGADADGVHIRVHIHQNRWRRVPLPRFLLDQDMASRLFVVP